VIIGIAQIGRRATNGRMRADLSREGFWRPVEPSRTDRLRDQLRKGDVLVVWKLNRLSRSLRDVLTIMEQVANAKAGFRSLSEAIDTTSPAGRMMLQKRTIFAVWSGWPSRQSGMRGVLC
jgi:hypothetical protein